MINIKELINGKDSILVFDVDGVLALLEFGKYRHYDLDDDEWNKVVSDGLNFYTEDKVSKKMQKFLKDKDMKKIYVITTVGCENEAKYKKQYLNKYYNILYDNIYFVDHDKDKVSKLNKIKELNPDIDDYKIVMIEDTVKILNDVMDNTNYSTAHISSFLDI